MRPKASKADALRAELAFRQAEKRREIARRSFREFCRQAWEHIPGEGDTPLIWNWHMEIFCAELEALVRGKAPKRNLVINVPPGSGKSSFVAVMLPAWVWLWWPEWTTLFVSGAEDVSMRDSMKCRGLLNSEWYRAFGLPWKLASDQDSKGWFKNTKGGERQATTIGSKGTGKRVHAVFFDDPNDTKDTSDVKLDAVTDSYRYRFQNRLKSMRTGIRCLIQQRTHMKDLTGWIMEHDAPAWSRICIRQEFERNDPEAHPLDPRTDEGELFFAERDDRTAVESQRMILGAVGYSGQHQQRPVPSKGGVFDVDKIQIVDYLPPTVTDDLIRARAWDFAYSEDRGDYTASAFGVIDRNATDLENVLYILEVTDAQVRNPLTEVAACLQLDNRDVHYRIPRDPGGGSRTADEAVSMCLGRSVGDWRPTQKKEATWIPLSNWIAAGRVRLLRGPWNQKLLDQMRVAPRGKHDDMIDACTELYGYLSQYGAGEMSFRFF